MAERLLTPSKITAWLDCAHFLTLQHQVDAGTLVVERSPFGEMAALLLQKGMDHEAAVLDGYRAAGSQRVRGARAGQGARRVVRGVGRAGRQSDGRRARRRLPDAVRPRRDPRHRRLPRAHGRPRHRRGHATSRSTPSSPATRRSPATCCSCASTPRRSLRSPGETDARAHRARVRPESRRSGVDDVLPVLAPPARPARRS